MQAHLAGIDIRKEVFPYQEHQPKRRADDNRKDHRKYSTMFQRPGQRTQIAMAKLLKPMVKSVVNGPNQALSTSGFSPLINLDFRTEQVVHHVGHQRSREQ